MKWLSLSPTKMHVLPRLSLTTAGLSVELIVIACRGVHRFAQSSAKAALSSACSTRHRWEGGAWCGRVFASPLLASPLVTGVPAYTSSSPLLLCSGMCSRLAPHQIHLCLCDFQWLNSCTKWFHLLSVCFRVTSIQAILY